MRPSSPAQRNCYNQHAVGVCTDAHIRYITRLSVREVVAVVADAWGFCPLDGTDLNKLGEYRRKNAQAQSKLQW